VTCACRGRHARTPARVSDSTCGAALGYALREYSRLQVVVWVPVYAHRDAAPPRAPTSPDVGLRSVWHGTRPATIDIGAYVAVGAEFWDADTRQGRPIPATRGYRLLGRVLSDRYGELHGKAPFGLLP
jgi:hypothetical protein